jgi:catechol 2,3-dioxygenase-like lactoylglutathione lyase family enzyme
MLGPIRAVTTTASDLDAVEAAYTEHFGYRVVERAAVTEQTALGWGAPAVAGKPMLVLMPGSGNPTYLRFVQQDLPQDFRPMTTFGWNSTEIVVQDTDALQEKLKGSPFDIQFPPRQLDGLPDIRAMQGTGPAGEVLYLTWIQRPIPGHDLPVAQTFVDQCFIVILGGPDMEAMRGFYKEVFGNQPGPVAEPRILILSHANGMSPETRHKLSTVPLGAQTLIEIDEYPATATPRPRPPGGLPPGMAIVTFEHKDIASLASRCIAPPAPSHLAPSAGNLTATLIGAAGELIELVEV